MRETRCQLPIFRTGLKYTKSRDLSLNRSILQKLNSPQSYRLMQAWPIRRSSLEFFSITSRRIWLSRAKLADIWSFATKGSILTQAELPFV